MKALAVVIGFVFAVAVAALALAIAFPDRFGDYLPGFVQSSVQGGPQVVLQVEPDGVDMGQAVTDSIGMIDRRLKDLGVRFTVQPQDDNRILLTVSKTADVKRVIEVATRRGRRHFTLIR